jgi:hypothetical protein
MNRINKTLSAALISAAITQTLFARTQEYVDIDALMRDTPQHTTSKKQAEHPHTVQAKQTERRRAPEGYKPHRMHQKRIYRHTPEHFVRRHYGHHWRHARLRNDTAYRYGRAHYRPRRGWVLAYAYDGADFYDRYGFYYGDFDRFGFYFEGRYFRYTPRYTYRDRLRGRGYFDRSYYAPARARMYGFCE